MKIVGLTGSIGHGKSTFIQAMHTAAPHSQMAESSAIIAEVANVLNKSLQARPDLFSQAPDNTRLKNWLDQALPDAIKSCTSQPLDSAKLTLHTDDVALHPERYEKLKNYLEHVSHNPSLLDESITAENKLSYRSLLQWIGGYVTNCLGYSLWYREMIVRARSAEAAGCELYLIGGVRFPSDAEVIRQAGGTIIEIVRPLLAIADADDPTELQRSAIVSDSTICNNGTIQQLDLLAAQFNADLMSGTIRSDYEAKAF